MVILHILASFAIALLSGMGVGSAGLFVLYLTSVAGLSQLQSQGVNLVFFLLSAGASFLYHVRRRRISWGIVLFLTLCAVPGSLIGAELTRRLDGHTVRRLFGGMLMLAGGSALIRELRTGTARGRE